MPTPPPKEKPSLLDKIKTYGGNISLVGGLLNQALTHFAQAGIAALAYSRSLIWEMSPSTYVQAYTGLERFTQVLGKSIGGAGVVLGSIGLFQSIQSMFQNGVSKKGLFGAGQASIGVVMGANAFFGHAGFIASLTNPAGWAVLGGVVAFSVVWGLTHRKSPELAAADKLVEKLTPVYWVNGPILAAAAGTTALVMGWTNLMGKPPVMGTITMPKYMLEEKLKQSGTSPTLAPNGATTFIEQGCQATLANGRDNPNYPACLKTSPTKVFIVTPNGVDYHGNPAMKVTSFELYKNLQFVSSSNAPGGCYIPFFSYVGGQLQPNLAVINGLTNSDRLLQAVIDGRLDTQSAQNATRIASASNKDCVDPATL